MDSRATAVTIVSESGTALAKVSLASGRRRSSIFWEQARSIAQRFGGLLNALLGPVSLIAYAFALWRVAGDIGWLSPFVIQSGFFSHWLVWLSIGLTLTFCASILRTGPAAALPADPAHGASPRKSCLD